MADEPYIKPKWLNIFSDGIRPTGIAMMLMFITVFPLLFSIIDLGFKGAGARLAAVLASYFSAIPDTYYTTFQVIFLGYVAGKSGEVIATKIKDAKPDVTVPSTNTTVNLQQERDAAHGTDA